MYYQSFTFVLQIHNLPATPLPPTQVEYFQARRVSEEIGGAWEKLGRNLGGVWESLGGAMTLGGAWEILGGAWEELGRSLVASSL